MPAPRHVRQSKQAAMTSLPGAALISHMRGALFLTLLLALCAVALPGAHAVEREVELPPGAREDGRKREPPLQLYGGPRLLLAGRSGGAPPDELGSGMGFQLGAAQYGRYVGIGPELRFAWLDAFANENSLRVLEVLMKPSAGFAFAQLPLRIYMATPCGLSLTLLPRGAGFLPSSGDGVLGTVLGATAFVWQRLGLNAEVGYQWTGPRRDPLVRRELTLALNLVHGL
jgi:hypothetical protein